MQQTIGISHVGTKQRLRSCDAWEGMRTCTDIAPDPVVSGKNRRFGIFHCRHELFKCSGEGWVLIWSVDDDTTLKHCVSRVLKNSIQCDCAYPDPADLRMGLEDEGSDDPLHPR